MIINSFWYTQNRVTPSFVPIYHIFLGCFWYSFNLINNLIKCLCLFFFFIRRKIRALSGVFVYHNYSWWQQKCVSYFKELAVWKHRSSWKYMRYHHKAYFHQKNVVKSFNSKTVSIITAIGRNLTWFCFETTLWKLCCGCWSSWAVR